MGVYMNRIESKSPFRVLREQAGISLEHMADAICIKPDALEALEADQWERVTVGVPLWSDLLARVGCVVAGRSQFPTAPAQSLSDLWHSGMIEIGNAFNEASWR